MSILTSPARPVKPLCPATGSARVVRPVGSVNGRTGEVLINGKPYYLEVHVHGYRLYSHNGRDGVTLYDLPLSLDSCDSADATYRGQRPGGCKHARALRALLAAGKLPCPPRVESCVPPCTDDAAAGRM